MKITTAKAAILVRSREPLIVDEINLPEELGVGQVLVKINCTTICGAQINEIEAAKGPDKFLPQRWTETYATADIVEYDGERRVKVGREFLFRK